MQREFIAYSGVREPASFPPSLSSTLTTYQPIYLLICECQLDYLLKSFHYILSEEGLCIGDTAPEFEQIQSHLESYIKMKSEGGLPPKDYNKNNDHEVILEVVPKEDVMRGEGKREENESFLPQDIISTPSLSPSLSLSLDYDEGTSEVNQRHQLICVERMLLILSDWLSIDNKGHQQPTARGVAKYFHMWGM